MILLTNMNRKEYFKNWRLSPHGKASRKKYNKSDKGKLAQKRWRQSLKGKISAKKRKEKYLNTSKGKIKSIEQHKGYRLNKEYGLSLMQYNRMLLKQNNKCAICGKSEIIKNFRGTRDLSVDHNHKTKKIRGLLCGKCNSILGFCNDSIIILNKIIKYIKKYNH